MKLTRFAPALTAVAVVAAATPVLLSTSASAAPAPYKTVKVTPGTGIFDSTFSVETSAKCTDAAAVKYSVSLQGTNLPEDNLIGLADLSTTSGSSFGGYKAPSNSFKSLFDANGISPVANSPYTLTWYCKTSKGVELSTFTSTVTFAASSFDYSNPVAAVPTETSVDAIAGGPFTYGDAVTLSASVAADKGTVSGGTVQFKVDGSNVGAPQAVSAGKASLTTSAIVAGTHTVTADFIAGGGFDSSTGINSQSLSVAKKTSTVTLDSNGIPATATDPAQPNTSAQYAEAIFTAQAPAGVAGTVDFFIDGAKAGSKAVDASGKAVYTDKTLGLGVHPAYAVFKPTDAVNVSGATSATINHTVKLVGAPPVVETLTVEVQPGSLTISLADGEDGQVKLSDPVIDQTGEKFVSTGAIDPVTVTDTRAGDLGWAVQASVSDFAGPKGAKLSGYNLGFTPKKVTTAAHQNLTVGSKVNPALVLAGAKPADAALGLYDARTVATTPAKAGTGTAKLAADLLLQVPTELPPGLYTSTLTITVS